MIEDKIIEEARSYLGVKFRHQGKTRMGMDCRGLLIRSFEAAGLDVTDVKGYGRNPQPEVMNKALLEVCERVNLEDIRKADILYIRFDSRPTHLALYKGNNSIIHAYLQMRKVVEHEIDKSWWLAVAAVYRHKELM